MHPRPGFLYTTVAARRAHQAELGESDVAIEDIAEHVHTEHGAGLVEGEQIKVLCEAPGEPSA